MLAKVSRYREILQTKSFGVFKFDPGPIVDDDAIGRPLPVRHLEKEAVRDDLKPVSVTDSPRQLPFLREWFFYLCYR